MNQKRLLRRAPPTFSFMAALLSAVVEEEVVEAAPAPATPMSEPGACSSMVRMGFSRGSGAFFVQRA